MRAEKLVRALTFPLIAYGTAISLSLFSTVWFGSLSAGLNQPDEPSHFLNSVFVRDYLHDGIGINPMRFATEYYLHYPKLAIGHWPPAYYVLLGILFLILPATPKVALVVNVLVSTLPVIGIAAVVQRFLGKLPALLASIWYISLPVVIWSMQFFLLDQPLTAAILAAAGAWVYFSVKPTMPRALLLAALVSLAVLIKGNGWLVALFPLCHIAFTGRWKLLADKYTYLSLIAALSLVVPWYAITVAIAADGFNYEPGIEYAWLALQTNLRFLMDNAGPVTVILALFATWSAWIARRSSEDRWEVVAACLALISATLLFQAIVPAALEERYIEPALPPLVVLATLGICVCQAWSQRLRKTFVRTAITSLLILAAVYPSLRFIGKSHAKGDLRLDLAAARVVSNGRPAIWIIDGSTSAEGALVAEVAIRDPGRQIYVVRSSQLLAVSDFMGRGYRLKYPDPATVIREVRALGTEGVILVDQANEQTFEHSAQLRAALLLPQSGYRQAMTAEHVHVPGQTQLYETTERRTANLARLHEINFPTKAGALGASVKSP